MTTLTITARTNSSVKLKTHKDMDFKITLGVLGAKTKEEAIEAVNEMLGAYDFYGRKVEENPADEIEINWLDDEDEGDVKPM